MRVSLAIILAVAVTATVFTETSAVLPGSESELERPLRTCKWYQALCRFLNPCWQRRECHGYPDAVCKTDMCECRAEYYDGEEKIDCREVTGEHVPEPEPEPSVPSVSGEGCQPVVCRIFCLDGYVKDADGCDICECVQSADRPGMCPAVGLGEVSTCGIECSSDAGCDEGEKCCSNGCGRICTQACSPVRCRINCQPFGGYARDANGCEICRCLSRESNKVCPAVDEEVGGICVDACEVDNDCSREGEKCCRNGCGHTCMQGCEPVRCRLFCEHGYETDENSCKICQCKTPPGCSALTCRLGCKLGFERDENGCEICSCVSTMPSGGVTPFARGRPLGTCPSTEGAAGVCVLACSADGDCDRGQKCCSNGCGQVCRTPCPRQRCRIGCKSGYVKDDNGCDICRCKRPKVKPGTCPAVPDGALGICTDECETDEDCGERNMKCCSNGCGRACTTACSSVRCFLGCRWGFATNSEGCKVCECLPRPANKPGQCPAALPEVEGGICTTECRDDADCGGDLKCCSNNCGQVCVPACPKFKCRITCPFGYVRDLNECKHCECEQPPRGIYLGGIADLPRECPAVPEDVLGLCVEECGEENACPAGQMCCSNGCGHACVEGCVPLFCRKTCPGGYARNEEGCEICECKEGTLGCPARQCRMHCPFGVVRDADGCDTCQCRERPSGKVPQVCPVLQEGISGVCVEECSERYACPTGQICCSNGCGHECIEGCRPVLCRMRCSNGWATDENNCEICQCKVPRRPDVIVDLPRECPAVPEDVLGLCVEECGEENACPARQICCSNGCGHACVEGCVALFCRKTCPGGYARNEQGCEICECKEGTLECPARQCRMHCPFGMVRDADGCDTCQCRERPSGKVPQVCPVLQEGISGVCVEECSERYACPTGQICCSNGCGHECIEGCRPVLCRMRCSNGWATDENNCEICQCKVPRRPDVIVDLPRECPAVPEDVLGLCVEECGEENACPARQICCSNGCGHACVEGCVALFCRKTCPGGYARNEQGCEICECKEGTLECPARQCRMHCPFGMVRDADGCDTCQCRERPSGKVPQVCPVLQEGISGVCVEECSERYACPTGQICCSNGCGHECIEGCRPVLCRMRCSNGWATDENNCEICQCKVPRRPDVIVDLPRECPAVPEDVLGLCVEECGEENACPARQICCSNGCGHACVEGCVALFCRKTCPGGYARNEQGCEICECKEGTLECPARQCRMRCPFGMVRDADGCDTCQCRERPSGKVPQVCPVLQEGIRGVCVEECSERIACPTGQICCSNGCGHECIEGCRPVLCRMGCRNGWATDENNCEICQCKMPRRPDVIVDLPRECPAVPEDVLGLCVEECGEENACPARQICCSNGCGHACVEGCVALFCRKTCPGGYARNEQGCEICECKEGTKRCQPVTCRKGCRHGWAKDEDGCEICQCKEPPTGGIPRFCPAVPEDIRGVCVEECSERYACPTGQMCCSNGCGHECVEGCRPVLCRLGCRLGFAVDETGCEICRCKLPIIFGGLRIQRECPVVPEGVGGICVGECGEGNACHTGQMCCSNVCGNTCVEGCSPVRCRMHCQFGWARNEDGCEICQCQERPGCRPVLCRLGCRSGFVRNDDGCEICRCKDFPDGRPQLPMVCPAVPKDALGICSEECSEHSTCAEGQLCCSNGCGQSCVQACPAVMCLMYCRFGWETDENNCEICRCKERPEVCKPLRCRLGCRNGYETDENGCSLCKCRGGRVPFNRPPQIGRIPEVCPVVPEDVLGLCVEECGKENACPAGQMCCSNGCGHACVQGCRPVMCRMFCSYGWDTDEKNCEICACKSRPAIDLSCPALPASEPVGGICIEDCGPDNACTQEGYTCCSNGCGHTCIEGCLPVLCRLGCEHGWAKDERGCDICTCAAPPIELLCPSVSEGVGGICVEDCSSDRECVAGQRCCSNGCGHACVEACRPVLCYMHCKYGWVRDDRGCEICQCAPEPPIEVELLCPEVPADVLGLCVEQCGVDDPCTGERDMCCSNNCGHTCVEGCRPVRCRMTCPQGYARDERGCEMCRCDRDRACPRVSCGLTGCQHGLAKDEHGCETCHCNPAPEDLVCPAPKEGTFGLCVDSCIPNTRCGPGELCCSNGCGHQCMTGCAPANCPPTGCQYGLATDENGCETCRCNPPPPAEVCSQGKEYRECGSACPDTCEKRRSGLIAACIALCVPGCSCPAGSLLDSDNLCVEEQHCGCMYDADGDGEEEYYQIAHSFSVGDKRCQCHQGGEVVCKTDCVAPECPPTGCQYGHAKDENGCETCNCNPVPEETCEPVRCRKRCRFGFKIENGCPVCKCNDPPEDRCKKPKKCRMFCTYGFAEDKNGCEVCECNPPPDVVCQDGKVYEECGTSCPMTCQSIRLDQPTPCVAMCVQGCFCPPGTVLDSDGMCVKQRQCGCLYDGDGDGEDEYYKLGESFTIGKRERCQCRRDGRVMCTRKKPRRN